MFLKLKEHIFYVTFFDTVMRWNWLQKSCFTTTFTYVHRDGKDIDLANLGMTKKPVTLQKFWKTMLKDVAVVWIFLKLFNLY